MEAGHGSDGLLENVRYIQSVREVLFQKKEAGIPDNLAMDSAGYAILEFEIHFRNSIFGEYGRIRDVACMHVSYAHLILVKLIKQGGWR